MSKAIRDTNQAETDFDSVRERVKEFVMSRPFSLANVARKASVPFQELKSFLDGEECARVGTIAAKLNRLLTEGTEGSRLAYLELEFVETNAARQVMDALKLARQSGMLVGVLGPSGVGKSCAARQYVRTIEDDPTPQEEDAVYVAASSAMGPKDFLESVAESCGATVWRRNMKDMQGNIAEWLREPGRLLIIDESDFVSEKAFHALRHSWDRGRSGVVFLGTKGWLKLLERYGRASDTVEQFLSRFGYVLRLSRLDDEDMAAVLEQFVLSDSARDAAIAGADGNMRRAISACRLASEIGDGMMSAARIKAAFSRLAPVV